MFIRQIITQIKDILSFLLAPSFPIKSNTIKSLNRMQQPLFSINKSFYLKFFFQSLILIQISNSVKKTSNKKVIKFLMILLVFIFQTTYIKISYNSLSQQILWYWLINNPIWFFKFNRIRFYISQSSDELNQKVVKYQIQCSSQRIQIITYRIQILIISIYSSESIRIILIKILLKFDVQAQFNIKYCLEQCQSNN
ncbi:unnamed protein product (macronuclear) [Paramecium tetraurelia]|uniref:Transmembrane protein n=1 Tax=Paramecium tetraurelia TaxID=5888 RepID=A0CMD5_PARTE|nr:uncharacterized protein GSPATT00008431001 [Paramecium tetraurelia]CAK71952.1 unnamed protein product [Paramecium tetraurelia]|eukprot:XP_001439349.1 hypothetical protein (macronuclear) [Paramecium tetraurelia strain d4-2]